VNRLFLSWAALTVLPSAIYAAWTNVPSLSPSPPKSQFASYELYFSDSDYEVPYYLKHFAQVANAVVETTFTNGGTVYPRGFLNIKVNREVADNMPYNARIMEMQMALAYFYTVNRPWNVYRGSPHVKVRLEAMLTRWVEMQNADGLFAEYSANNFSLAPTGFGVMAAAQALDLIQDSGLDFDATVFNNAKAALRKALMALFTRSDMQNAANSYSNQFSGAYHAALLYLENWPDTELNNAFVAATTSASSTDQSATGYFYEADGPDFGYSNVHERNLRIALTRMRSRTNDLMPIINADEAKWSSWLGHNLLLQPGISTPTFLINAGINTRTSTAYQEPESRPLSEFTPLSRAFSYTDTEFTNAVRAKTDSLASTPTYGTLTTNSAYSYQPGFVFEALQKTESWHPTASERTSAQNLLPYLSSTRFARLLHDTRKPLSVLAVRRPAYYALFNYGNVTVANRVKLGLGALWNPSYGTALQAVAGATNTLSTSWGTLRNGGSAVFEQRTTNSNLSATVKVNGATITPSSGTNLLADGSVTATYSLIEGATTYGTKTVTLDEDRVKVDVVHTNSATKIFTERVPLIGPTSATLTTSSNRITLAHTNGSRVILQIASNTPASISVASSDTSSLPSGLQRRAVTLTATNQLSYELQVTSDYFQAGTLGGPTSESYSPANGGPDVGETVSYNLPLTNLLGATTTTNFTATLQASGGVTPVTLSQKYGAIAAGATGTKSFSLIAGGNFGDPLTLTLALADGTNNYGTVSYQTTVGGTSTNSTTSVWQNFDGVAAPALPSGWSSVIASGSANGWKTTNATAQTSPNSVFAVPTETVSEQRLDSGLFSLPANAVSPEISFQHRWNTENTYDGGLVEISINGGSFQDVSAAGGSFLAGGYSGTLSSGYQNPLGGRSAWYGSNDTAYTLTRISLPASVAGKTIQLRFRLGSDSSVTVSNAIWRIDSVQASYRVSIYQSPASITSAAPTSPVIVGVPFAHTFAASGTPAPTFSLSSGTLPTGLLLSTNGLLSGSVSSAFSSRTITVTASNGVTATSATPSQTFTLSAITPVSVTTGNLPSAITGSSYSQTLAATGGSSPYTWVLTSGTLPAGMGFSSTGTISGIPLSAGTTSLSFTVTDSVGAVASKNLSLTVSNPASLAVVTPSLPGGMVATSYSQSLTAVSGSGSYAWALASGALPTGLSLSSSGTLSGNPSAAGVFSFTLRVTDSASATATRSYFIEIAELFKITTLSLPEAVAGTSYSQTLAATNGTTPYGWTLESGSLPPGLSLSSAGIISGTPSTSSATFTVRATDAAGLTSLRTYTLAAPGSLTWDADTSLAGPQTGPGTWTTAASSTNWITGGTNVAWVDGSSASISGTLTLASQVNSSNLTFQSTGATILSSEHPLVLRDGSTLTANGDTVLSCPLSASQLSINGSARLTLSNLPTYPGSLIINNFEFIVFDSSNRTWSGSVSGSSQLKKQGDGTLTLSASNSYTNLTTISGNGGLRLTHAWALGTTHGGTKVEGGTSNAGKIELEGGLTVAEPVELVRWTPNSLISSNRQIRSLSGTNEWSGTISLSGTGNRWDIGVEAGRLRISGALTNIHTGTDSTRTLFLSGPGSGEITGPASDSASGNSKLNLAFLSGTWALRGTNKTYSGTTTVSNGASLQLDCAISSPVNILAGGVFSGIGSTSTNLTVTNGSALLRSLTNWAALGTAFSAGRIIGSTGTTNWTIRLDGSGLIGFSETPQTVPVLTGTLSNITPSQITVVTTNFPGQGTWTALTNPSGVSITYAPVALAMDTQTLPGCYAGTSYARALVGSGGVAPHFWSVAAGELPPGLSLSSSGLLAGTPSLPGDYSVEIQLADAAGINVRRIFLISIDAPLAITTAALDSATANVPYSRQLGVTGGVPTYSWSVQAGSLPPGLSLSEDGFLSGTPTTHGTFAFTLRVDDLDPESPAAEQSLTLAVAEPPYLAWSHFIQWDKVVPPADSSTGADPDQDGIPNLLEFALGSDPLTPGPSPLTAELVPDGASLRLQIRFSRAAAATDLTYWVEGSSNLSSWDPVAVKTSGEGNSFESMDGTSEIQENAGQVIITDGTSSSASPRRFLRLKVSR
jgi:autotransporter-associated beta strand protein